jgi:hypothetical protein
VLYWQGVRSLLDPNGTWKEIPTPPMVHERGTESGSYVTWMKACVQKGEDRLVSRKAWDTTLTLPEAVLYNIYMMDLYGQDFVDSVFSFQRCFGSKRSASGGSVGIEWDLQDIKVCLRVSG